MMDIYNGFPLSGCLASEKLDGVNATWNGTRLLSKEGNQISAPSWFVDSLPKCQMTGELWAGRGEFETVLSALNSRDETKWQQIRFMVIDSDIPLDDHQSATVAIIERRTITDEDLAELFQSVVNAGGEGLVIRDADGKDWKHKPIADADAVIIEHVASKSNPGWCGSFMVNENGNVFKIGIGIPEHIKQNPPPIGTVIRFAYQGRTKYGKPRFAAYISCRFETST